MKIPNEMNGSSFWQCEIDSHASERRNIVWSIELFVRTDQGIPISIQYLVIDGSSHWIFGRNIDRKRDLSPIKKLALILLLSFEESASMFDYERHSYVPSSSV